MNAEQLAELVKGWPPEAKPAAYPTHIVGDRAVSASPSVGDYVTSGLEWLYSRRGATDYIAIESVYNPGGDRIEVRLCDEDPDAGCWVRWSGDGPTLIAAVSAAIMAVAGATPPQLVKPGGKRLPPGPLPEVNPQCGYITIGPDVRQVMGGTCYTIDGYGTHKVDEHPHGINGLEIPPGMPVHTVVCIDGKARALDADGKIIASNVPGDPGVGGEE